jgi:hypothetical protein
MGTGIFILLSLLLYCGINGKQSGNMKEERTSEQKIGFQNHFLLASKGGQLLR